MFVAIGLALGACGDDEAAADTDCPIHDDRLSETDPEWADAVAANENCDAAEGDCGPVDYLSCEMAMCVAEEEGLADGVAPWECSVSFSAAYGRVTWFVSSTQYENADGAGGRTLAIDAESGEVLDRTLGWTVIQ